MASGTFAESESGATAAVAEDMELENPQSVGLEEEVPCGDAKEKREREEVGEGKEENGVASKKQKVESSVEEVRLEKMEERNDGFDGEGEGEEDEEEEADKSGPVVVGPKSFESSVEMFNYFFKFLHFWAPNINANKYEHMMLLDLIKKGHPDPEKKIGSGINSFQIRYHPQWKSRCFFLVRTDKTEDDFSFRKCIDHILPLPENMKVKSDVYKVLGGGGPRRRGGNGSGREGGGGGGRGRGRGSGGRSRR